MHALMDIAFAFKKQQHAAQYDFSSNVSKNQKDILNKKKLFHYFRFTFN